MNAVIADHHCPRRRGEFRKSLPHHCAGASGMLRVENADHQVRASELFEPFYFRLWDGIQVHSRPPASSDSDKIPIRGMRTQVGRLFNSYESSYRALCIKWIASSFRKFSSADTTPQVAW